MPGPTKKRYFRTQIAYLIIICTLKQGLSLALIQKIIPMDISEEEVKRIYEEFIERQQFAASFFLKEIRGIAGKILKHEDAPTIAVDNTTQLIISTAIVGSFSRLLSEKLLLLEGRTLEDGDDISIADPKR